MAKRNTSSYVGVEIDNNTDSALTVLNVSYNGEQWRENSTGPYTTGLVFTYSTDATSLTTGTWTPVPALDFVLPVVNAVNAAVDGNVAGQVSLAASIGSLNVADGGTIWFRWFNSGSLNNNGIYVSIDDFSVAVPEPSTYALIFGFLTLGLALVRRRLRD